MAEFVRDEAMEEQIRFCDRNQHGVMTWDMYEQRAYLLRALDAARETEVADARAQLAAAERGIEARDVENTAWRADVADLRRQLATEQKAGREVARCLDAAEDQWHVTERQLAEAQAQNERLHVAVAIAGQRGAALEQQLAEAQAQVVELDGLLLRVRKNLGHSEANLGREFQARQAADQRAAALEAENTRLRDALREYAEAQHRETYIGPDEALLVDYLTVNKGVRIRARALLALPGPDAGSGRETKNDG
jgi:chromosome segregation ATPase